ncbi:hypothetical protein [Streptomyces sp. NPDC059010]|uniref:hypothetical protein n=1 Tax=Streptomyces sp. NPDC059010 TaxID=3346695 RepID=UPI003678617A
MRGEVIATGLGGPGVLRRFSLRFGPAGVYYDHVVREADPQHGICHGSGEHHEGRGEQGRPVAVVQQRGEVVALEPELIAYFEGGRRG